MKHFELYRWYKQDDPVCSIERDLSILRIGRYWLLNFNMYHTRIMRSVGVTANFGFTWPGGDLFTLNLYLYKKNLSGGIKRSNQILTSFRIDSSFATNRSIHHSG